MGAETGGLAMSNLTISIEDEIIKRARVRAIQQGTSLSAKVREFLQFYVNESDDLLKKQRADAAARLMQAIEAATARAQPETTTRNRAAKRRRSLREDLYHGDFRARARQTAKAGRAK
jgi:plasmid stability protein